MSQTRAYATRFVARVWIHNDACSAAAYATDLLQSEATHAITPGLVAIPVLGRCVATLGLANTRGSVV